MIHTAMNCLQTVLPLIENERPQIDLSDRMIRFRLAEMHTWVGDMLLNTGEASQARVHLRKSLRHQPWQPSAWKALALATLPGSIRQRLRRLVRELKLRLRARQSEAIAAANAG
jgi:predicted Zn-dependent protease